MEDDDEAIAQTLRGGDFRAQGQGGVGLRGRRRGMCAAMASRDLDGDAYDESGKRQHDKNAQDDDDGL